MLNVTDVKIRLTTAQNPKLKAFATIIIDDCFAIHDVKVIDGESGIFVAMPSKKSPEGEFKDIVHPINAQTREYIKDCVLKSYQTALETENE